ncbi:MAG: von Willebrand factor type A domain-containing protein [bacterium]
MSTRFLLPATLLVSLGAAVALAQATGTIEGVALDAATGKGIDRARCTIGRTIASTSADGRFSVNVAAGTHTVACEANGYARASRKVTVIGGGTVKVELKLRAAPAADPAPEPVAATEVRVKEDKKVRTRKAEVASGAIAIGAPPPAPRAARPMPTKAKMIIAGGSIARPDLADRDQAAGAELDREAYDKITDNPFKSALQDPLSTFSIDVDTAAYANVRRFLNQGALPPKDAVRIEELLNYFTYDYPDAKGEHPFSVSTEISIAPWNKAHRLVHIGIQGRKVDVSALPPANLVFLLDVSGSMNNPDKLPLLKQALSLLVNNLRPQDRVAIVVYAGAAGLVLPSTSGKDRGTILGALESLSAGGSTAGGAGIKLAYQVARDNFIKGGNNRIILATDGDFNVGASSDSELERMIEQERKSGVFLTILGFGQGNYQDAKMEKLSNAGNGNAAYIDSILEAQKVLVTEMGGTLLTIAKDVKLQIEFNPAKVKGYRLIGYENRMLAAQDFNDDKKDAGELGAGTSVTALYEIIPAGAAEALPGVDELKYQKTEISDAAKASPELMTVKLRYKQPDGDTSTLIEAPLVDAGVELDKTTDDFRFSTAVAELGLLLRDSPYKGDASFDALIARAKAAMGEDKAGYRFDFVGLAKKAQLLHQAQNPRQPLKMAQ